MKVEFESLDEKPVGKKLTGNINIAATININAETGEISIVDNSKKIQINFINLKLAKQWADAVK